MEALELFIDSYYNKFILQDNQIKLRFPLINFHTQKC